ncbi:MAG TPA: hypothetical protein DDX98_14290 [Bacteroidales bacterium]|jgi:hypothetical protein|nr:hypothetical protein [Bacteroidales bacterium]
MIFKSNNKLEEHIKNMMAKGLSNRGIVVNAGKKTKGLVLMKSLKSPLAYLYGWDCEDDYWIISSN